MSVEMVARTISFIHRFRKVIILYMYDEFYDHVMSESLFFLFFLMMSESCRWVGLFATGLVCLQVC